MESPSSPAHTGRPRLAWRLSLGSETRCCKRPGVVGPLTPVGSKENTLRMKRDRAVLSPLKFRQLRLQTLRVRIFTTIQCGILQR